LNRSLIQLFFFLAVASCVNTTTEKQGPLAANAAVPDEDTDKIQRGDTIEVKVFMEQDLSGVYPVGADGAIRFPLIGKVDVIDKSSVEVAVEIQARLTGDYLKDPQVTVLVKEHNSQRIHVLGQVEKAGTFGFRVGMSVIEAITNAGGFTKLAAPNRVRVTRVTGNDEKVYELAAGDITQGQAPNFLLEPGDIVYVPEAIF
jgi:protein involved in polysaccharide export with SLBB domain